MIEKRKRERLLERQKRDRLMELQRCVVLDEQLLALQADPDDASVQALTELLKRDAGQQASTPEERDLIAGWDQVLRSSEWAPLEDSPPWSVT